MKRAGLFWHGLLSTTVLISLVSARIDGPNINISEDVIAVKVRALTPKHENTDYKVYVDHVFKSCRFVRRGIEKNVDRCLDECTHNTSCTVVNFKPSTGLCYLRSCQMPYTYYLRDNGGWNGYAKRDITPEKTHESSYGTETTIVTTEDPTEVRTSTAQYIATGREPLTTKMVTWESTTLKTIKIPKAMANHKTPVTQEEDGTMVYPCSFSTIQKYWPHPKNCNMFIHCTPTGPVDMICPQGTAWSTTLFFCIHTANTKCDQDVAALEALPLNTEDNSCQCGVANRERIIGGAEVGFARKYPWQISLQYNEQHRCGGSIINDRWILTAAHCLYFYLPSNIKFGLENPLTVVVGEHIHSSSDDDHGTFTKEYSIKQYIVHPYFQYQLNVLNDFGLLEVTEPIVFGNTVRPVCLPQDNKHLYANRSGIALGWGKTSDDKITGSDTLKELKVTIHSLDKCKKWHDDFIWNKYLGSVAHPSFICASGDSGSNVCNGDSGGPLLVFDDDLKRYVLVGVTSFGKVGNETHTDCDHPEYPAVYARVTEELIWINEITSNGKKCD